MSTTTQTASFTGLFGTTFKAFKGNYGLCCSLGILIILLALATGIVTIFIGILFSSRDSLYSGAVAGIIGHFLLFTFIFAPLAYGIGFKILARLRGETGMRSGWFLGVLKMSILFNLVLLPGVTCQHLGDPGSSEELKLLPETISLANSQGSQPESDQSGIDSTNERAEAIRAELDSIRESRIQSLRILGTILVILGVLLTVTWVPFGAFAACDPRETCQGFSEIARRGLELTSGARPALLCTYLVLTLILGITFAMCVLPGLFFGLPLGIAWLPACYLFLRDGASPEADLELS